MEIVFGIIGIIIGVILGYIWAEQVHKNQMALLAADSSLRLQEMHRELVLVCTEQETSEAQEIILRHRLNVSALALTELSNERTD